MENSNEDIELLEFNFRRDLFKQGERVYIKNHKAYASIIGRHPFADNVWMVNLEYRDERKTNTSIYEDQIEKCQ